MISPRRVQLAHQALGAPALPRADITRALLAAAVTRAAKERGLSIERTRLRLLTREPPVDEGVLTDLVDGPLDAESIGQLYEISIADRKQRGVFFTPAALASKVAERALQSVGRTRALRVCDPAVGGGAFLLAVLRQLDGDPRDNACRSLYGFDRSELALHVAEACIWLEVGDPDWDGHELAAHLICADTLGDLEPAPEFDLVIGNPPWVAYAGRAAQPLEPEQRSAYARRFTAFSGYPTLHGMFVERAAELAPSGVVALLLPSPIADLAGYAPVRQALTRTHRVCEPLLELGQDAFEGVTQPCFALIAERDPGAVSSDRSFRLIERQRSATQASELSPPEVLARIAALPTFPKEIFGERGFQSAGEVSKKLLLRSSEPDERHHYPLLEGKDVAEFRQRSPRLFLNPDPEVLARARCRLRSRDEYERVAFVVRQTAALPIAALHSGWPFRNSLLGGFDHPELPAPATVALLNSALYRALHLARNRDARQAAFPQVKIAHLRALPRPPAGTALGELARLAQRATELGGAGPELRAELDRRVYDAFDLSAADRAAIDAFLARR